MPYFRTTPSTSLGASIRNAIASSTGNPLSEIAIENAAARTAREAALATKARQEAEAARDAAAARQDPGLQAEYASHSAGLDLPTGNRLAAHIRGVIEQPMPADIDDAGIVGAEARPAVTTAPAVSSGQRRLFQSALAAAIGNRLATGKTNADQLSRAAGNVQGDQLTEAAIAPGVDLDQGNRIVAAAAGKSYLPFRTNSSGTVLNAASGDLDEGGELAQRVRALAGARASQATAAAGASNARRDYIKGPQTELAGARTTVARDGKPATPVAPERVQRMIDMTALGEFKAAKAAYDALPIAQKKAAQPPTLAGIRETVASRYAQPDTQQELQDAQAAIARGADPVKVRARFKQRRGFDLPDAKQAAASDGGGGDTEDDDE